MWVAAALAAIFVAGSLLVPLLEARRVDGAGLGRLVYRPLCHQLPERSLQAAGHPLPVCARCFGLYLGGLTGMLAAGVLLVGRRRGPRPVWFLLAALPTVVDALLAWAGLGLDNLPRLLLALPPGLLAGIYLSIAVHDLFDSTTPADARGPAGSVSAREVFDG